MPSLSMTEDKNKEELESWTRAGQGKGERGKPGFQLGERCASEERSKMELGYGERTRTDWTS